MKRFASVTFDGVLAASDRDGALRALGSSGALATSWSAAAGRTFAFVQLGAADEPLRATSGIRIDEPPLVFLRIVPRSGARIAELERALSGPGRPAGIVDAWREPAASVIAFAPRVTSLGTIVALVDAILEPEPGRAIEALLPLDDTALAAFASELLDEPNLDAARLIETHLDPLLECAAR